MYTVKDKLRHIFLVVINFILNLNLGRSWVIWEMIPGIRRVIRKEKNIMLMIHNWGCSRQWNYYPTQTSDELTNAWNFLLRAGGWCVVHQLRSPFLEGCLWEVLTYLPSWALLLLRSSGLLHLQEKSKAEKEKSAWYSFETGGYHHESFLTGAVQYSCNWNQVGWGAGSPSTARPWHCSSLSLLCTNAHTVS